LFVELPLVLCYVVTMETEPQPLPELAKRFAEEFLIDFKAGPAALRAGYEHASAGHGLLKDYRVQALIKDGKFRASGRVQISVDMVLENFRVMTSVTAADFFEEKPVLISMTPNNKGPFIPDPSGRKYMALKPLDAWTDEMKYALKSIKHGQYGPEIVLHDKAKTNESIGKFLGMWVDKVEHDMSTGALEMITAAMDPKQAMEAYLATMKGAV